MTKESNFTKNRENFKKTLISSLKNLSPVYQFKYFFKFCIYSCAVLITLMWIISIFTIGGKTSKFEFLVSVILWISIFISNFLESFDFRCKESDENNNVFLDIKNDNIKSFLDFFSLSLILVVISIYFYIRFSADQSKGDEKIDIIYLLCVFACLCQTPISSLIGMLDKESFSIKMSEFSMLKGGLIIFSVFEVIAKLVLLLPKIIYVIYPKVEALDILMLFGIQNSLLSVLIYNLLVFLLFAYFFMKKIKKEKGLIKISPFKNLFIMAGVGFFAPFFIVKLINLLFVSTGVFIY